MNKTAGKARSRKNKFIHKVLGTDDKRKLIKLVGGTSFDLFIMGIILADAIVLGLMTSEVMSMYFDRGLFLLDRLFMGIFIVEMFLKIYAQGRHFFKSGWNVFDFVIVAVSSIPSASAFIILRTFRLFRLLKYIHRFSKMHNIIEVFIGLLPTFVSFLAIFAVFFYVFAIIAVSQYGEVFTSFATLGQCDVYAVAGLYAGWLGFDDSTSGDGSVPSFLAVFYQYGGVLFPDCGKFSDQCLYSGDKHHCRQK